MSQAFNLARRLSARNEPDLLQEDYASPDAKNRFTQQYCFNLVKDVCPSSPLPMECHRYPDVLSSLQRRNSNHHDQMVAFAGMSPGEKAAAMAAREHGRLSQAQVKRRLTSTNNKHSSWWS